MTTTKEDPRGRLFAAPSRRWSLLTSGAQMVLPKERAKAGIKAGDKLAVTSWEKDGKICCIASIKADNLETMVKGMLGPVMGEFSRIANSPIRHSSEARNPALLKFSGCRI